MKRLHRVKRVSDFIWLFASGALLSRLRRGEAGETWWMYAGWILVPLAIRTWAIHQMKKHEEGHRT